MQRNFRLGYISYDTSFFAGAMDLGFAVFCLFFFSCCFYGAAALLHSCDWNADDWFDVLDSPPPAAAEISRAEEEDARNLQEGRRRRVCRCGACMSAARKRGMSSE